MNSPLIKDQEFKMNKKKEEKKLSLIIFCKAVLEILLLIFYLIFKEMAPRRGKKKVDGLSIERLTLLGRVHVARVVIDQLKLVGFEQNTTPSKKKPGIKSVGKPPKPSPKVKKAA